MQGIALSPSQGDSSLSKPPNLSLESGERLYAQLEFVIGDWLAGDDIQQYPWRGIRGFKN
jgi:hypothetical protein